MRILKIDNPGLPAEGMCNGLPYTTQTYNADGCAIHFWVAKPTDSFLLVPALNEAMNARDIVVASWSLGEPGGFWAHQDIN